MKILNKFLSLQATKLKLWRLERQRKCLVWQKRYLQAVLQSMEDGNGNAMCKSSCNCTTSSSEGHSISFDKQDSQNKNRPTFR